MPTPKEKDLEANQAAITPSDGQNNRSTLSIEYADSEKQSATHSDGRPSSEDPDNQSLERVQGSSSLPNPDPYEEVRPHPPACV